MLPPSYPHNIDISTMQFTFESTPSHCTADVIVVGAGVLELRRQSSITAHTQRLLACWYFRQHEVNGSMSTLQLQEQEARNAQLGTIGAGFAQLQFSSVSPRHGFITVHLPLGSNGKNSSFHFHSIIPIRGVAMPSMQLIKS